MKNKILNYINLWVNRCYHNGIPDEAPVALEQLNKVPSYRAICIAILKNDHCLKSLGYSPKKSEYYNQLKRIELGIKETQLNLF